MYQAKVLNEAGDQLGFMEFPRNPGFTESSEGDVNGKPCSFQNITEDSCEVVGNLVVEDFATVTQFREDFVAAPAE